MDTTPPTAERQATTKAETKLSNGKIVVLTEYGWHQPQEQLDKRGDLNAEEVAEAWKLWDAAQKATPPGAQPNNPVGERPDSEVGRRPPAGNGARSVCEHLSIADLCSKCIAKAVRRAEDDAAYLRRQSPHTCDPVKVAAALAKLWGAK